MLGEVAVIKCTCGGAFNEICKNSLLLASTTSTHKES